MMGEKEKFIVRISCDPKIEPFGEDFSTKFVDKILTLRVEKVNESVISQLRDLMKEKGVNELYAIDESKVLEIVKKAQAFDIISKKGILVNGLIKSRDLEEYNILCLNHGMTELLTQEEYDLIKELTYAIS